LIEVVSEALECRRKESLSGRADSKNAIGSANETLKKRGIVTIDCAETAGRESGIEDWKRTKREERVRKEKENEAREKKMNAGRTRTGHCPVAQKKWRSGTMGCKQINIYAESFSDGWGGRASGAPLSPGYAPALIIDHMCRIM
jgi:hypothetical protein